MMPEKGDNLSDLKITRNTYSFVQRKRYSPIEHYEVKKSKAENPLQELAQKLQETLKGKKAKKEPEKKGEGKKKSSSLAPLFIGAAAFILLIVLAFFWILISSSPAGKQASLPSSGDFNGTFSANVFDSGLITYGTQANSSMRGFLILDYSQAGLSNFGISANIYASPPSNQVFMLSYNRDGADTYGEFRKSFDSILAKKGWMVNDIMLQDLKNMPQGATLIIPTGHLPYELLGADSSYPSIADLAKKGIVVIYIGQAFDTQVMDNNGNFMSPNKELLAKTGITFAASQELASSNGLRLQAPLYSATLKNSRSSIIWGSVSSIPLGSGFLLFFPETLDGGWTGDGSNAGEDLARFVYSEPFRPAINGQAYASTSPPPNSGRLTFYFDPINLQSAYMRITYSLNDSFGNTQDGFIDWPMRRIAYGDLFIDDPVLTPQYLGGARKTVLVRLNEPSEQKVKLFFELYKDGQPVQKEQVEQGLTSTQLLRSAPVQFNQDPGTYILRVVDGSEKVYAATLVQMSGVEITPETPSFRDGSFNFTLYSAGKRIKVPYCSVSIKELPSAGSQTFENTDFITYKTNQQFKKGSYTFVFDFGGGYSREVNQNYNLATNVWERPEIIILAIFGVLVFVAGFYFRRPQKLLFSLDIPDFPPQSVKKIPLSSERILLIFEQINSDYRWSFMPVSMDELKGGFRKLIVNGKSVIIGDYNLERILDQLSQKGLVEEYLGFWAPKSWEQKSGFSIKLLASYRYLRNLFVNNAIRFSRLGAAPNCDVKIIIGKNEYFLHIYLGNDLALERALQSANKGITWLLFPSRASELEFSTKLGSSSPQYLIFKMHVESGKIRLYRLDELAKTIQKLKVD